MTNVDLYDNEEDNEENLIEMKPLNSRKNLGVVVDESETKVDVSEGYRPTKRNGQKVVPPSPSRTVSPSKHKIGCIFLSNLQLSIVCHCISKIK